MNKAKLITNPAIVGPGGWILLHIMAKNANTAESKIAFIDFMQVLSYNFPCKKCRTHIQAYLRDHPFEPYMNLINENGEDLGMFKWSWIFHNTVNERLNKDYVDWETAWDMYNIDKQVCTKCSGANSGTNSGTNSATNSETNSYDDSNETRRITEIKKPLDKKAIIQGYFMKKRK